MLNKGTIIVRVNEGPSIAERFKASGVMFRTIKFSSSNLAYYNNYSAIGNINN